MQNDYKKQAYVWDWDGYDNTSEYQYWCEYAKKFGSKVLIPMCSHGQIGAYMANNGFNVVAFDITPEMIAEGKKRYSSASGLSLIVADILDLNLQEKNFDFAFIAGNDDLNLLQTIQEVEQAFLSISKHMRIGACLVLELTLPFGDSWSYPKKIFHPRVPNHTDKKIWKENEGRYDAKEKRNYINQTVYIEDESGITSFTQNICLQYYERETIIDLLTNCGFAITGEYVNRDKEPWRSSENSWIVEVVKQ